MSTERIVESASPIPPGTVVDQGGYIGPNGRINHELVRLPEPTSILQPESPAPGEQMPVISSNEAPVAENS